MSQIKKGAILSYLLVFISIIIALVYTPIMIRLLGQSEYGLYAMIGSVAAYFSILDLGLGNAIVRYTSRNRIIGNKDIESKLNGIFLILFSIIAIVVIVIGVIIYQNFSKIFVPGLTSEELKKAKIMIIILIINFAISFPLSVFSSILQAYEKFVVVKFVEIARTLAIPFITLPILFIGYGSIAMVIINSLVNISSLLFNVYYSIKFLKVKFYFGKMDTSLLKEILGYSFFVFLGIMVDQIYWNTDQFILGAFVGTVPVAIYAIAMQFINIYKKFSTSLSGLFLPKASMLIARKVNNEEITNNMIKYGRIQFILLSFILNGFIIYGRSFINFWAGSNYDQAYFIVLIIMIPLTIPLFQNFAISVLYAKNMQKFRSVVLVVIAVLNIIITIPLVKYYGAIGAAIGTAISLTIGNTVIMNFYYHRRVGINMIRFWGSILKISIPITISLILGLGINVFINFNKIYFIPVNILIYFILYICLLWVFGFNAYEKRLIISIVKKLQNLVSRNTNNYPL